MYENILFEKKDGVAYLTLNRPDQLNALNSAVLKELDDALAAIDGDAEIRVLVVRGAGEKALAAGADITEMQSMEAEAGMAFGAFGQQVFAKIEALRQPSIAMIPGFALGGGCELALACDIRIASEKARFGQPEVGLGITAGFGGTQRLPRLVGRGAASRRPNAAYVMASNPASNPASRTKRRRSASVSPRRSRRTGCAPSSIAAADRVPLCNPRRMD